MATLTIAHRKHLLLLLSLINLILTPIYFYLIGGASPKPIIAFNFLLILLAGYNVCKKFARLYFVIGGLVILSNIALLFYQNSLAFIYIRLLSTIALYMLVFRMVLSHLFHTSDVNLNEIFGALCGYILIGLFGGMVFELIYYAIPNSFSFDLSHLSDFHFYYFSFTGITTVGFGDIVPINPQSQSITILINITGQVYLAVVMALFVGKFITSKK